MITKINVKQIRPIMTLSLLSAFIGLNAYCSSVADDLVYKPGGKGFEYKVVTVSEGDFNKWAKENKEKINKTIDALEEGSVLLIVGHTDSSGPRTAVGNRKGNVWYSTNRAKAIYNAMLRQGIKPSKLAFKGIADDELANSSDPKDQINRRVTFKVVSK